ncbi:MAG TPA: sulfotransferase, partial [Gammaproteobacteria bacterium]|nr:sulfotransferase [Gammaproteobacteria bacterium]
TSLVEQILAGHPELAGGGELPFLPQSLSKYAGTLAASGDKIAALSDESLRAMGEHYLAKISALYPGARRITDKLPGNFMLLGLIHALFPKARIIHCRRDPLDTCVSCYLTHFDAGHHYAYDQTELGAYYLLYRRMLDYYAGVIGPSMLTVDYEDLVGDVAGCAPKIVEFCGLPWNPACLEFDKTARMVKTASMYQVRQAVNSRSIGRWRRYAEHVGPLRAALGSLAGPE